MKLEYFFILLIICFLTSCANIEAESKNYISDVSIKADKLSCDGILMENYTGTIDKSEFFYGESIKMFYDNITGFTLKDSLVYPEMDIFIMNKKGDTIMSNPNLFKDKNSGFTEADLRLRSELTFANPMFPNNDYILNINIRDKHSDAYFILNKNFSVIHSTLLKMKTEGLTYDIQYLFSNSRKVAVLDNKIKRNEIVYLLIHNLKGYDVDAYGQADILASIRLTDADGNLINENTDLFPNLVNATDLKEQLYASIQLTGKSFKNPVTCVFKIKDNNSSHNLETTFNLTVED
ncbi:hypothetical protein [Kordia sp.]|uniref:hypothetical protein n=1 Tax=Kordia sp. TaxID=1965332 RepID=UPI003B5AD1B4